jgi:hypothetical protein
MIRVIVMKEDKLNLEYVSENKTELCVMCKADTNIPINMNINFRNNYVEGVGQLCVKCG